MKKLTPNSPESARFNQQISDSGENQTIRKFCSICGSSMLFYSPYNVTAGTVEISIATLDDPKQLKVDAHIYTATKVPWIKISDGLPQYRGYREEE
ncbi:MAG: hypothetical protein HOD58_10865 [Gammaproteobacteria bacterium]|jgi:hypothetical protein|nr:hypothetical protein [Gammaproteobacteria bacterium]MBT4607436.1 hypothetical protein [Thiotrichales bacterium]MBT4080518.1 hypothetical protein [Gammaproteobacteria bacterium]MBT4330418.1 hypothetical protein [Gammaproteobacteria bacterium]MBT4810489.1 hypothetical protein [Thiotrichales bacterium]